MNRSHLLPMIPAIARRLSSCYGKAEWTYRCFLLNQKPGTNVSRQVAYFARTASIQSIHAGIPAQGLVSISPGVRIADGVILVAFGGTIVLNDNVFIGPYCTLYGNGGISIGKNTIIAGHSFITAANHIFSDVDTPIRLQGDRAIGISIGMDVWIGSGVTILDGVSIGDGCVIGAGCVVTKSLPNNSIAVGVPAKIIGFRGQENAYRPETPELSLNS